MALGIVRITSSRSFSHIVLRLANGSSLPMYQSPEVIDQALLVIPCGFKTSHSNVALLGKSAPSILSMSFSDERVALCLVRMTWSMSFIDIVLRRATGSSLPMYQSPEAIDQALLVFPSRF